MHAQRVVGQGLRGNPRPVATPATRLAVERIPSLAPGTAARSQPARREWCRSLRRSGIRRLQVDGDGQSDAGISAVV